MMNSLFGFKDADCHFDTHSSDDEDTHSSDDEFRVPLSSLATADSTSGQKLSRVRTEERATGKSAPKRQRRDDRRIRSSSVLEGTNLAPDSSRASLTEVDTVANASSSSPDSSFVRQENEVTSEKQTAKDASHRVDKAIDELALNKVNTKSRKRSIVQSLYLRSITGISITTPPYTPRWKKRTSLSCSAHMPHAGFAYTITAMAWDPTGVLLAAATSSNTISVWEWDVWVAQDVRKGTSGVPVPPTWTLPTTRQVVAMEWNSRDDLAVIFRATSSVRIYHVAKVIEDSHDANGWVDFVPPSTMSLYSRKTPSALCFSSTQPHMLWVSYVSTKELILWNVDSHTVVWRCLGVGCFTCIRSLPDSSVLVGATNGSVKRIDASCRKTGFGIDWTSYRPTILEHVQPSVSQDAGFVRTMQVNGLDCQWVTSHGWVFNVRLTPRGIVSRATKRGILPVAIRTRHAPPPVKCMDADGVARSIAAEHKYSVPQDPIVTSSIDHLLSWQEVPAVTRILPHHDEFVGDRCLQVTRSTTKALRVLDSRWPAAMLPARVKLEKSPTSIAIHPNGEWIVVACRDADSLGVWTAKGR